MVKMNTIQCLPAITAKPYLNLISLLLFLLTISYGIPQLLQWQDFQALLIYSYLTLRYSYSS